MVSSSIGKMGRTLSAACLIAIGASGSLNADDTEIFTSTFSAEDTGRPRVLIIFDDSGSMSTKVTQQPPAYDPSGSYTVNHDSTRIYWSTNGEPPSSDTANYFSAGRNRCAESFGPLSTVGFFQGKALRWKETPARELIKNSGWVKLNNKVHNPIHVDCETDVLNANPGNGPDQTDGYPFLSPYIVRKKRNPGLEYAATTPADSNAAWDKGYTFYTAHYMDYFYDPDTPTVTRTRLAIAQDVVKSLISGNPGIDFGLALFNRNYISNDSYNNNPIHSGGRIVKRIIDSDDATVRAGYQTELLAAIDATTHNGYTPLCESTYEAYRYLAGLGVYFGDDRNASYDHPDRDIAAENGAKVYNSPANNCAYTYIILMTDGKPTRDTDANNLVETLTGKTCKSYSGTKNCLPDIAEYMANTDLDGDTTNGDQFGITYTIGFTTNQTLLSDTALKGKGEYYTADSATELTEAFQGAILSILATDATFTSPSVAVDSFTRTRSRNDVFFSMFKPTDGTDWPGNIKKLKVKITDGTATLVDKNDDLAIQASTGEIKPTASTFWSSNDGGDVEAGGMGEVMVSRGAAVRVLHTNSGTNGALEAFDNLNLTADAYGFDVSDPNDPDGALFDLFGVSSQSQLNSLINWAKGYEIDDSGNTAGTRSWILADMLHSKPLIVNYGALGSFTVNDPDLRLVVGTNGGFLHMFGNNNGQEDWAFFPKELAPVLNERAKNTLSGDHVYGVDGSPVLYTMDVNRDGTIDDNDGDKAYVYFGLRRGGNMLYALDISDPDNPVFLWMIDDSSSGFSELGQTWSAPVVTRIPGYFDGDGKPKPVLIFGAGYDTNKDNSSVATSDSMGRGLYIVDAATGALVWSVTPAANSATNLRETGLLHSVAGVVSPLDSNGDSLTDRVYFADTGGDIWRVDMPGNSLPTTSQDTWRIVKLAAMNGGSAATDRRFFNAPGVVRTKYGGTNFDAILIGSGDRTNPNAIDVDNQYYMIRDRQVLPYFTPRPSTSECTDITDPIDDFRCDLPLTPSDLYDTTSNVIQTGDETQRATAVAALANADGWRLDLEATGEKSLSRSLTLFGVVYFGTFSPETIAGSLCVPDPGTARLYAINLFDASEQRDFDNDGSLERFWVIGSLIPDTPSPHFGSDGEIRLLLPPGSGGDGGNPMPIGESLTNPYGSYWYREDY